MIGDGAAETIRDEIGEFLVDCVVWNGFYTVFFKNLGKEGVDRLYKEWTIPSSPWSPGFVQRLRDSCVFYGKKEAEKSRNKGSANWSDSFSLLI